MPNDIISYYLKSDGKMWVETIASDHRPATEQEWLEIWQSHPQVTVQLCSPATRQSLH
ncbi:MAG: hypothetical protein HQ503_09120 [Rhodospirillales bacterium]|nr:hypothetical protein [Rhodospirillales bacterium]